MIEQVLARLGFRQSPPLDRSGLNALYRAWCLHVPFDNLRKRLHMLAADPAPLPGGTADDFFENWLAHGTGGTCWPTSNALFTLLVAVGFEARRATAAMLPDLAGGNANHGSVIVRVDGDDFLVDSSMLLESVLALRTDEETAVEVPPLRGRATPEGGRWRFGFTTGRGVPDFPCALLDDDVTLDVYLDRYEWSREVSPFNEWFSSRRNHSHGVVTVTARETVVFDRQALLGIEPTPDFGVGLIGQGYSEEMVSRVLAAGAP